MIQSLGELEFRILDKNGTLELMFKKPLESFISNFIKHSYVGLGGTEPLIDTGGTPRTTLSTNQNSSGAPVGDSTYGIQVGTGTNAVTINDYKLQTKIAHGTAADQLSYQATPISAVTVAGSQAYFSISRNFNNGSGGTITVQEVCWVIKNITNTWYFLWARDLTGAIDVLNGKTLVTQYTFKVAA